VGSLSREMPGAKSNAGSTNREKKRWKINGSKPTQSFGPDPGFIHQVVQDTEARRSGIGITKDVSFLRIDHSASPAILFGVRQAAQNSSTERKDVRRWY
jgi:hypothetical protein